MSKQDVHNSAAKALNCRPVKATMSGTESCMFGQERTPRAATMQGNHKMLRLGSWIYHLIITLHIYVWANKMVTTLQRRRWTAARWRRRCRAPSPARWPGRMPPRAAAMPRSRSHGLKGACMKILIFKCLSRQTWNDSDHTGRPTSPFLATLLFILLKKLESLASNGCYILRP